MKIAFFEVEGWEERMIRESFSGEKVAVGRDKITSLDLPNVKDFEVLSIFIDSRIDKGVLDHFPDLKCIATRSTGYDHIDLAACKEKGIAVTYVPGYGDNTVAEFAFGLLLSLTRKIYQGVDQIKETGSFELTGLRGVDIKGKVMGVVGAGRIGKEMVKIANGFGMTVIAYDPHPDKKFAEETGLTYVDLDTVLARADIISLHCPYTKETHHLISVKNISRIKPGAYLVNTARGAVVETQALVTALEKKILAGAALDVLEEEGDTKDELTMLRKGHPQEAELRTILANHILMKMPNVLITPHNAFNSQEALERILKTTIENIKGFISGKPVNLVT